MNILLGNRICPLTSRWAPFPWVLSESPIESYSSLLIPSWDLIWALIILGIIFFLFFIIYYLFVCAGSLLWLAGLAAVSEISVLQPGIRPGSPSLGVWYLIHWTTWEVSWPNFLMVFLLCFLPCHPLLSAPRTQKTRPCMSITCLKAFEDAP